MGLPKTPKAPGRPAHGAGRRARSRRSALKTQQDLAARFREERDRSRSLEELLIAERRLYLTILSSTPDLVYVFGLDHRFTYANKALLQMWGKTWEQAIGKNFLELGYPPWHAAMHDREIERVIATKRAVRGEAPFTGTLGRRVYDYIFVPVLDAKGAVEAIAGTTRDVTDLRHHAASLGTMVVARTAELRSSVEELERFTYTVAHDLRAPLRAIHRFTEMLLARRGELTPAAQEDYLRQVADGAKRMDRLIEDLLHYSKIGLSEMKLVSVDVGGLVHDVIALLASEIEERRAWVAVLPFAPTRALGDPVLLTQALTNLLTNALKFVPPGRRPEIEIGCEKTQAGVRVWVQDNGIGIEPRHREHLFKLFERLHGRERYPGAGIGLAIVSRCLERLGGSVGFDSVPGEGSRFWILLQGAPSDE